MLRKNSTIYTVDGSPLLEPDEDVEITLTDLDAGDSGRDESGVMCRIVVRENMRTFGFTYSVLDREDYAYLKNLLSGKTRFTFGYVDEDGQPQTMTAYCAKKSIVLKRRDGLYKNLKFNIIEN